MFRGLVTALYRNHKRRTMTVGGWTEWQPCERGMRQGCVLSPLLFALFLSQLEDIINESGIGVRIGAKIVGGLFFADDIVLKT